MIVEYDYIKTHFNLVEGVTAVCTKNVHWSHGLIPELEVGRTYHVTHIGVQRSDTLIILSELPKLDYSIYMFDLYKDGTPFEVNARDPLYLAPYLRKHSRKRIDNPWLNGLSFSERLQGHIKDLERIYGIKILLVMETGSRLWGYASQDSDWDVRFIYRHVEEPSHDSSNKGDVIQYAFNDDTDMVGWEENKALSSLIDGELPVYEWLCAPASYEANGQFTQAIKDKARECFNPMKMIRQYEEIYIKANERYISDDYCGLKTFLYYVRGILSCKWIMEKRTMPPVLFAGLLTAMVDDQDIVDQTNQMVAMRQGNSGYDLTVNDSGLISYFRSIYRKFLDEQPDCSPE